MTRRANNGLTTPAWVLLLLLHACQPAMAQAPQPASAVPNPGIPAVPSAETLLILIRNTVIALNQANMTGNYTVLRDLGTPAFQSANSAARLGSAFMSLRDQNLDLSAVLLVTPQVTTTPTVDAQSTLHLAGFFPLSPQQLNFDLMFQPVNGK